jgi:hypothetical protein
LVLERRPCFRHLLVGTDEFTIVDDEVLVDQARPYRRGIDWPED